MDIDGLIKSVDNLAEKAELTGNISFVTQSNSLRRKSKEKAKELKTLDSKLEEKLQALKKPVNLKGTERFILLNE